MAGEYDTLRDLVSLEARRSFGLRPRGVKIVIAILNKMIS